MSANLTCYISGVKMNIRLSLRKQNASRKPFANCAQRTIKAERLY